MTAVGTFLTRRRGGDRWDWTDIVTFLWLGAGVIIMFGPALWLVMSSFKSQAQLSEFPPTLLPHEARAAVVVGYDRPLRLFVVTDEQATRTLAELRRVGTVAQMVDPETPETIERISIANRTPDRAVGFIWGNYPDPFLRFDFLKYTQNSIFVTGMATLITLRTNSMAAFALSKYDFRRRNTVVVPIIATLMIPLSVILVPPYSIVFLQRFITAGIAGTGLKQGGRRMGRIVLHDIRKSYGAVDVREGELLVFVGPSGCGKSTLLRRTAGLAMVFQSDALYPHMTMRAEPARRG